MRKYLYMILSVIWMIIIYRFSAQTADNSTTESMFITEKILRFFMDNPPQLLIDGLENVVRKLAHFSEYFVLGILLYLTLRSFGFSQKTSSYSVLIAGLYAVSDEVHQYFVPGRACRWYDMLIDLSGAAFGYFVCIFVSHLKNKFIKRNSE